MENDAHKDWFSEDAATFGDRLAAAREAAGLDQSALAEQLGVQVDTVDAWENDLREPRANRVQILSGLLGVTLTWLLTGTGEGPSADDAELPKSSADILAQIRQVRAAMSQNAERLGQLEKQLRKSLTV